MRLPGTGYATLVVLPTRGQAYLLVTGEKPTNRKVHTMAYQDISNPSAVLNREITATRNFFGTVGEFFAQLAKSFSLASAAEQRFEQVQRLQAKSDEELAAMNIRRSDIVTLVFKDLYYV